jgi:hypothetical protein
MAVKKTAKKKGRTPPNAGKGRPKGAKNKIPSSIKTALETAMNAGDGAVAFWVKLKDEDPRTFAVVASKLIPLQIQAELNANINQSVTYTLEYSNPEEEETIEVDTCDEIEDDRDKD